MSIGNHRNSSVFSLSSFNPSYTTKNFQLMHLRLCMNDNLINKENEVNKG